MFPQYSVESRGTTNVTNVIADSDPKTHRFPYENSLARLLGDTEFRIFSLGMKSKYGEAPWRPKNNKDDTMS